MLEKCINHGNIILILLKLIPGKRLVFRRKPLLVHCSQMINTSQKIMKKILIC